VEKAIKSIEEFTPQCEQEHVDKKLFLEIAKSAPNSLTRENLLAHFTASAWVMNKTKTHVLCVFHKQHNKWVWPGGHCDGEQDFLRVAIKEVYEETGLENLALYKEGIFSLETMSVASHFKKGKYVPSHVHLNVTYVFIADDKCAIKIAESENCDVAWKTFDELIQSQKWGSAMIVYPKIANRIKQYVNFAP